MSYFPRVLAAPAPTRGLPIDWEEADCPLCASRAHQLLVEGSDAAAIGEGLCFAIVQCQECGLCFTNPRPSPATIGQFYPPGAYGPHRLPRSHAGDRWLPGWRWARGKERHALPWHGEGRLLDFGCGGGSFLQRMDRQGWHVTGLDASAATAQQVQAELGLRVLAGSLPHPELRPATFDVITMWHSLEHVHAPRDVLREAHQLLTPGGKLLVAVPNIDSLPYRWFGADWYGLDLPRHLTHFTPMSLGLMLERSGFRLGSVQMVRHPKWLRTSAAQALRRRRAPGWQRWLTSKLGARLVSWYSYLTRQTDCILATAFK